MKFSPWLLSAAAMGCAVFVSFWHLGNPRTVTAKIEDPALAKAFAAEVYEEGAQDVGDVTVSCRVYTNDPDSVTVGAPPKSDGWFVQACHASPARP